MAGTPEKMLEYLLETRIDCEKDDGLLDTVRCSTVISAA